MMPASMIMNTSKRGPPRQKPPRQPQHKIPSFTECVKEIEMAIAEMMRLDQQMTMIEIEITKQHDLSVSADDWDAPEIERTLDRLSIAHGQAETHLVMELNAVTYFGAILIDDWREHLLDNIGRRLSQCAGFYRRIAASWLERSADPVWMRLYGEGVPF